MSINAPEDKNEILSHALTRLTGRLSESEWLKTEMPYDALVAECRSLGSDEEFLTELSQYLKQRTILRRAVTTFFTSIAMAARAKWDEAPPEIRPVVARGWFLGRWIPTFLIIDGPIGRFFMHKTSPLYTRLTPKLPVLCAARDLLAEKTFRCLRNGLAHWGFDWEVIGSDSYIVAYDWEKDMPIAKLHQEEADAYHICAFAIIEVVEKNLFSIV